MQDNQDIKLKELENSNDIYMRSENIEQVNLNHQSNMTLCTKSEISQSIIRLKI